MKLSGPGYFIFERFLSENSASLIAVVVQTLGHVRLFVTPWTIAGQAPLSSTISWSLFKFKSNESVMLSNHLIVCCPLFICL